MIHSYILALWYCLLLWFITAMLFGSSDSILFFSILGIAVTGIIFYMFVAGHTHSTVLCGSMLDDTVFIILLFIIIVITMECSHTEIFHIHLVHSPNFIIIFQLILHKQMYVRTTKCLNVNCI